MLQQLKHLRVQDSRSALFTYLAHCELQLDVIRNNMIDINKHNGYRCMLSTIDKGVCFRRALPSRRHTAQDLSHAAHQITSPDPNLATTTLPPMFGPYAQHHH